MRLRTEWVTCLAVRIGAAVAMASILLVFGVATAVVAAGAPQAGGGSTRSTAGPGGDRAGAAGKETPPSQQPKVKLGLSINDPRAFRGYTLLNTLKKKTSYLMDME